MCRSEACSLPFAATLLPADMPFPRPRTQPMKPKLPRKLANSARINLNKYWHALEVLMPVSCRAFDESDSNAINENIDNERRLAAMRLSETRGVGNSGPSNSSEGSTNPSVFNLSTFGKNTSFLKVTTSSSNVLLDLHSSSSSESSSSLMSVDESPSSSNTNFSTSASIAESSCFIPSSTEEYPDENTPPLNGLPTTGGSTSR